MIEDEAQADIRLLAAAGAFPHRWSAPISPSKPGSATGPAPVHFREAFRTRGPSNYFLGKRRSSPGLDRDPDGEKPAHEPADPHSPQPPGSARPAPGVAPCIAYTDFDEAFVRARVASSATRWRAGSTAA